MLKSFFDVITHSTTNTIKAMYGNEKQSNYAEVTGVMSTPPIQSIKAIAI
jgi:hypothetical protein